MGMPARIPMAIFCALVFFFLEAPRLEARQAHAEKGSGPQGTSVGEVWIDDTLVIKLYGIGTTRVHREAKGVAVRLNRALSRALIPSQVAVVKTSEGYAVVAGREVLLVVSKHQAHLHHSTPRELAALWTGRIRKVLATETASVGHRPMRPSGGGGVPSLIAIPQGTVRNVPLPGAQRAELKLSDPEVARVDAVGDLLRIRGERAGSTRLSLRWGEKVKSFSIVVKDWAGVLPPYIETLVTGRPARGTFVRKVALEAISRNLIRKPGTKVLVDTRKLQFPQILPEGGSISYNVNVRIAGNGHLPVSGTVQLKVINFLLPREETAYLMVSNKPEFIRQSGVVFSETLLDTRPTRFLFHHANALPDRDLLFQVKLVNRTDTPSKVHFIEGVGGPHSDEVYTGHVATHQFLTSLWREEGKVVNLLPRAEHVLFGRWLTRREVTAGIYQLRVLEGGLLTVQVEARERGMIDGALTEMSPASLREATSHAKGVFEHPDIILEREHVIGDHYTFIAIGKKPFLKELFTGEPNYGNYGVLYQVHLVIRNPNSESRTARITFVPTAGVARGIFRVGEDLIETPMLAPFKQFVLGRYELPPGGERKIVILTTPQGGSFYPVNIVVQN